MLAMYDDENQRIILLMKPDELRQLAADLEQQQQNAVGGDSTINLYLPVKKYWAREWSNITLEIGYEQ